MEQLDEKHTIFGTASQRRPDVQRTITSFSADAVDFLSVRKLWSYAVMHASYCVLLPQTSDVSTLASAFCSLRNG